MTPGAGVLVLRRDHIGHILKMHHLFKNVLLYSKAYIRQTKYKEMLTEKNSTKLVNFMTTGAGVLVLGRGHINHIETMHYFF